MLDVIMLRTNRVDPDPRVEKEVNSLLKAKDLNIEVLAWDRADDYKYSCDKLVLKNGSATIHRIGIKAGWGVGIKRNAKAFIKYAIKANAWLMKNHMKYDCIHACDLHTIVPAIGPLLLFRKKLVYDVCDYFADTAQGGSRWVLKLARKLETFVINHADATIICSEKRIEQIKPAKPKRLTVIHNSPPKEQFECKLAVKRVCQSDSDRTKIVYVGNLVEDRCIKLLVDTVRELDDFELHIGGIGDLKDYVAEMADKCDNVYFYGKLPYDNVLALEKECDIMVAFYDPSVPNHRFAAPNKFYEAIAQGKPLVMFHNTGVDDIIDEYSLGVTVSPDIRDVQNGLKELVDRREEWKSISETDKFLYDTKYCWEIMEKKLLELYSKIKELGEKS